MPDATELADTCRAHEKVYLQARLQTLTEQSNINAHSSQADVLGNDDEGPADPNKASGGKGYLRRNWITHGSMRRMKGMNAIGIRACRLPLEGMTATRTQVL